VNFNAFIFVYLTWWLMAALAFLVYWVGAVDPISTPGLSFYWFFWSTFAGQGLSSTFLTTIRAWYWGNYYAA
jgi:hypothetical protein